MKFFTLLAPTILLVSCAGYRLGDTKPASLSHVKSIAVPMFSNSTLHPKAEVIATSAVIHAIVQDGAYQIGKFDQADAVLEAKIGEIKYSTVRGTRLDTLLPEELSNTVTIEWKLLDAKDPTKVLASGKSSGSSELSASSNLQTARNSALPEACERAGEAMVSRLSSTAF